jgi:phosphoribosyl 1,2-cyclic phosphate phosphodiesterase
MQSLRDGLALHAVTDLLVTHAHSDHITPAELGFYIKPFAHVNSEMHVWGSQQVANLVQPAMQRWADSDQRLHVLTPLQPVTLGDGTYVMPLPANHAKSAGPFNFIIRRGGKTLLYGMDSGWYPEEAWAAHQGHCFDVVVIDCTHGDRDIIDGHGSLNFAINAKEKMLSSGTAHAGTVFVANHFSHNGGMLHEEMATKLEPAGIQVGYDGMIIEV